MRSRTIVFLSLAGALAGCTASIPPVEVARFHLNQPITPGGVKIDTALTLEGATYASALAQAMARRGFTVGEPADYIAKTTFSRTSREVARRSPFTIGIGGGSFGGNVGVGVGTQIGLGKSTREVVVTRLSVQLIRRADNSAVWEGRAETEAPGNAPAAQPGLAAEKLANALFADFPGQSGRTVTVP